MMPRTKNRIGDRPFGDKFGDMILVFIQSQKKKKNTLAIVLFGDMFGDPTGRPNEGIDDWECIPFFFFMH